MAPDWAGEGIKIRERADKGIWCMEMGCRWGWGVGGRTSPMSSNPVDVRTPLSDATMYLRPDARRPWGCGASSPSVTWVCRNSINVGD
eukprot:5261675-Pleurochrysis_carterae.AAC.2